MDELKKPILPGKGASDYERYLRTDDLLALQKLPEELLHQDELTFQVVHQSSELLMKGAAFELERAHDHIVEGDFSNATRLLRRANQMLEFPISLLHILETITPYDYHMIRAGLGHGERRPRSAHLPRCPPSIAAEAKQPGATGSCCAGAVRHY